MTALREIAAGLVEQVPLSEAEPEMVQKMAATEEEEFAAILESPDLNVELDTPKEEIIEKKPKRKAAKEKEKEDELGAWMDDDEE